MKISKKTWSNLSLFAENIYERHEQDTIWCNKQKFIQIMIEICGLLIIYIQPISESDEIV